MKPNLFLIFGKFGPLWSCFVLVCVCVGGSVFLFCFCICVCFLVMFLFLCFLGIFTSIKCGRFIVQGCKLSGYSLNSGLHEVQILALSFIFSPFWRLLAWIRTFQAVFFRSAYIPANLNTPPPPG